MTSVVIVTMAVVAAFVYLGEKAALAHVQIVYHFDRTVRLVVMVGSLIVYSGELLQPILMIFVYDLHIEATKSDLAWYTTC